MRGAALVIGGCILGAVIVMSWHAMAPAEHGQEAQANGSVPTETRPEPPTSQPTAARAPPSLAEIAMLADDFQRNKALYELVAGTGRADVEDLLDQTFNLPSSLHRHDVARVLYVRFASIDPEAALQHLLGSNHQQQSSLTAVFRVWAHTDLDEAVRRATTLDSSWKDAVVRTFFDMDMPDWQRQDIAEQLDADTTLGQVLAREELASGTPEQAWANALAHAPGPQRQRQLHIAAQAWAMKDPQGALRAASEIGGDNSLHLRSTVLTEWLKADRAGVLRWLSLQEQSQNTQILAYTVVGAIAQKDIYAALDALEHVPGWARENAQQAIASRWVALDAAAAIAWIGSLPLAEQRALSFSVAHEYANRDPREALNWAMGADPKIRQQLLNSVFISLDDAALADQLFRSIDDPELRADLAHALFLSHGRGDPIAALQWATTFKGDVQDRLRSYISPIGRRPTPTRPFARCSGSGIPACGIAAPGK